MMKEQIAELLRQLENNGVKILFAIENGSRAWNMASKDSDYDVRFVFHRPVESYISLEKPDDVINVAYDENMNRCGAQGSLIDMSGFDVFKYAQLLYNSNPTTIEWLVSSIVYYGSNDLNLRNYVLENFNPRALFYHYFSLFKNNYKEFIVEGKALTLKKYLYSMRGLLNARFVYHNKAIPPLDFMEAVEQMKPNLPLDVYMKTIEIIRIKSSGDEKDFFGKIKILDEYFEENLNEDFSAIEDRKMEMKVFDQFLQKTILERN